MKHYNEIAILLLALSQIFISIRLMIVERKVSTKIKTCDIIK